MSIDKYASLFLEFCQMVRLLLCNESGKAVPGSLTVVDFDHNDPANRERVFLEAWNSAAPKWAAIESNPTYFMTVKILLELLSGLQFPKNRSVRLLSLGSGPGLYESFLGYWMHDNGKAGKIFTLDYAEAMVNFHKALLGLQRTIGKSKIGVLKDRVIPAAGDMTDLQRFRGSMDLVICNNALQWVADWRAAIREMVLALNPNGLRKVSLIVHEHAMQMLVEDQRMHRELVGLPALFSEAESQGLELKKVRYIMGSPGSGQHTTSLHRVYIEMELHREGKPKSWKEMKISPGKVERRKVLG